MEKDLQGYNVLVEMIMSSTEETLLGYTTIEGKA